VGLLAARDSIGAFKRTVLFFPPLPIVLHSAHINRRATFHLYRFAAGPWLNKVYKHPESNAALGDRGLPSASASNQHFNFPYYVAQPFRTTKWWLWHRWLSHSPSYHFVVLGNIVGYFEAPAPTQHNEHCSFRAGFGFKQVQS
jgi:hypothetical protein